MQESRLIVFLCLPHRRNADVCITVRDRLKYQSFRILFELTTYFLILLYILITTYEGITYHSVCDCDIIDYEESYKFLSIKYLQNYSKSISLSWFKSHSKSNSSISFSFSENYFLYALRIMESSYLEILPSLLRSKYSNAYLRYCRLLEADFERQAEMNSL